MGFNGEAGEPLPDEQQGRDGSGAYVICEMSDKTKQKEE